MNGKGIVLAAAIIILAGCGPSHYQRGFSFNMNPSLGDFGAALTENEKEYRVESYFQSSIFFRTEYVYENLNITMPKGHAPGTKHPLDGPGVSVWYASGGQGGQAESRKGSGYFIIRKAAPGLLEVEISATFTGFTVKGSVRPPESVKRTGVLRAVKGYALY